MGLNMINIAFQIDEPRSLKPQGDSSLMLIEEACLRGYNCWHYHPSQLSWRAGELAAPLTPITVDMRRDDWLQLGEAQLMPLVQMQAIWVRQDPPYDMHYLTATYLLEQLPKTVQIFNDPAGLRNAPEKLSPLQFGEFIAPTLISSDEAVIADFIAEHREVVAKPLYGFGGHSVFRFKQGDANIAVFLEHIRGVDNLPWMWQAFLPEVAKGERRILLVDGEVAGIFGREPEQGSIRANMRVGGTPVAAELTAGQAAICAAIKPYLQQQKLFFAGIDVIGDYLTEINVTSPTGLRAAQRLYGVNIAALIWDKINL
jgi:glutathione synthase